LSDCAADIGAPMSGLESRVSVIAASLDTNDVLELDAPMNPATGNTALVLQGTASGGQPYDHVIHTVAEADNIEAVREFVMQSRLAQWNRTQIHATWSLEEAMSKADELPTIF
jgi:hypothetical protein